MKIGAFFAALVIVLSTMTGCTADVTGTAYRQPACAVVGFEDLLASDPLCGKTKPLEDLDPAETARDIDINGRKIPYIIRDETLNAAPMTLDLTTISARRFKHVVVNNVHRFTNADVAVIFASDTCGLDEWYYFTDPNGMKCRLNSIILSAKLLTIDEARRVLTGKAITDIERTAHDSRRQITYYILILADSV